MEVCKSRSASVVVVVVVIFYVFSLALFLEDRKSFLCPALSVSIGRSHSMSRHRLRKPLQKFNMCNFVVSRQPFIAKAGIACENGVHTSRDTESTFCSS